MAVPYFRGVSAENKCFSHIHPQELTVPPVVQVGEFVVQRSRTVCHCRKSGNVGESRDMGDPCCMLHK